MKDKQVLIRITEEQNEAIEEFAEDREYNKSEAVRKIVVSRLVGDGYLEDGVLLADGGLQREINHTQNQVRELSKEVDEVVNFLHQVGPTLALAFAWFVTDAVIGLSDVVSIVSGLGIIALLIIQYVRWAR